MNKHLIVLGIVVLLICVGLSGCNEQTAIKKETDDSINEEDLIIGKWQGEDGKQYTFHDNGTCRIDYPLSGGISYYIIYTYEIDNDTIYFHHEPEPRYKFDVNWTNGYKFKDKDTLVLTFSSPLIPYETNEYIRIK